MSKALAIILARAGSKGLPGKNSMPIAGRPCAAWTIDHALAAKTVGRVVLSTDDQRLIDLAHTMGIESIHRPADLASDSATVDAAARHAAAALVPNPKSEISQSRRGDPSPKSPIVLLYANIPVRPAGLIDLAVRLLVETGCDSVQSYAPVGKMHPWWTARVTSETGGVAPWEGDLLNHGIYRRQDLPPAFIPDGGVLVVTHRSLFSQIPGVQPGPHAFLGIDRRGVITGEGEVVDIDSRIDAYVAEAVLNRRDSPTLAD